MPNNLRRDSGYLTSISNAFYLMILHKLVVTNEVNVMPCDQAAGRQC